MKRERAYVPIGDYAVIGDMHSAALVSSSGSIDWCCFPHFDDPAVFCRILDAHQGGFFSIAPVERFAASRRYAEETNVLETRFDTSHGAARLFDFMPIEREAHEEGAKRSVHSIVRILEGERGSVDLDVVFKPTFGYAADKTEIRVEREGVVAGNGRETLVLSAPTPFELRPGFASARVRLSEGDTIAFRLVYLYKPVVGASVAGDAKAELAETLLFWKNWLSKCDYRGYHADLVRRSALVLKLLIFEPTGALIAAPTTSLPEEIGGVRNWDYRFSWTRDSTLILSALMALRYREEALAYFRWIEGLHGKAGLQIMYTIHGSTEMPESEVSHLEGYKGSAPVRVGNAASGQIQLDRFGQVLNTAYYCFRKLKPPDDEIRRLLSALVDEACSRWQKPDHGIWEIRDAPRHFLHSKLMCWVAVDRGIKLAASGVIEGDVERWEAARRQISDAIIRRGFNGALGAFTQSFDSDALDASALTVPLVGFLPFDDPRVLSTVDVISERLVSNGLVHRYLNDDGLPGGEGTFLLCTFWLIDNWANQNRVEEAKALFEKIAKYANNVGLLSEEIDPVSGEFLGNYPQGFTHLALIRSAVRISRAEERSRAARA